MKYQMKIYKQGIITFIKGSGKVLPFTVYTWSCSGGTKYIIHHQRTKKDIGFYLRLFNAYGDYVIR